MITYNSLLHKEYESVIFYNLFVVNMLILQRKIIFGRFDSNLLHTNGIPTRKLL